MVIIYGFGHSLIYTLEYIYKGKTLTYVIQNGLHYKDTHAINLKNYQQIKLLV